MHQFIVDLNLFIQVQIMTAPFSSAVFTLKKLESSAGKKPIPQIFNATPFLHTYNENDTSHMLICLFAAAAVSPV